jgi:hypothetical protein
MVAQLKPLNGLRLRAARPRNRFELRNRNLSAEGAKYLYMNFNKFA